MNDNGITRGFALEKRVLGSIQRSGGRCCLPYLKATVMEAFTRMKVQMDSERIECLLSTMHEDTRRGVDFWISVDGVLHPFDITTRRTKSGRVIYAIDGVYVSDKGAGVTVVGIPEYSKSKEPAIGEAIVRALAFRLRYQNGGAV